MKAFAICLVIVRVGMSASNGILYGTTQFGRSNSFSGPGTAFGLTTNGFLTTLVSFAITNGSLPQAALAQGSDGNLYGTTKYGGTNLVGNVFQLTPDGGLTNLYSFEGGADGIYPVAPLLPARSNPRRSDATRHRAPGRVAR